MFVVMYDLRAMPAGHQTFLRQRTFSVPVRRDANNQNSRKPFGHGRTLRYLVHLRWAWRTFFRGCDPIARWHFFERAHPSCLSPNTWPGSRAQSLGRSTSTGTYGCCFPGSPWRSTVVLPTSFSPSQSPPSTRHIHRAAETQPAFHPSPPTIAEASVTYQSQRRTPTQPTAHPGGCRKRKELKSGSRQDLHGQCLNSAVPSPFVSQDSKGEELRGWETGQKWTSCSLRGAWPRMWQIGLKALFTENVSGIYFLSSPASGRRGESSGCVLKLFLQSNAYFAPNQENVNWTFTCQNKWVFSHVNCWYTCNTMQCLRIWNIWMFGILQIDWNYFFWPLGYYDSVCVYVCVRACVHPKKD